MIITRADIEKAGYSKEQAAAFINSALRNGATNGYCLKMGRNIKGDIASIGHFDLDKFIEAQRLKLEIAKPNNTKLVKQLFDKLVLLKKRIGERDE